MRGIALLAILVALSSKTVARADKPAPPTTYKITSADDRFVFVMISPDSLETEMSRWNEQFKDQIKAIRTVYTKSGLYRNDNSKQPQWTVDWYRHTVAVPSDGIHLVRFGGWPYFRDARKKAPDKKALQREALSFLANGKLLREYSIGELVDRPEQLPRTVSHFKWLKSWTLQDPEQRFEAITYDGNRLVFDLKTGKLLKKERLPQKLR